MNLIKANPELQNWMTYDELANAIHAKWPQKQARILYGLCKKARMNQSFDSVKVNHKWYIKYIGEPTR